jgi:hypothetical protein
LAARPATSQSARPDDEGSHGATGGRVAAFSPHPSSLVERPLCR